MICFRLYASFKPDDYNFVVVRIAVINYSQFKKFVTNFALACVCRHLSENVLANHKIKMQTVTQNHQFKMHTVMQPDFNAILKTSPQCICFQITVYHYIVIYFLSLCRIYIHTKYLIFVYFHILHTYIYKCKVQVMYSCKLCLKLCRPAIAKTVQNYLTGNRFNNPG